MQGDEDILTVALDAGAVGLRLDRAPAEALPNLSRERVKTLLQGGRVADGRGTLLWDPAANAAAAATPPLRLPIPAPAHTAQTGRPSAWVRVWQSREHRVVCIHVKKRIYN